MNLLLTDDQKSLKDLAAKAAKQIIAPLVEKDEETATFRPDVIKQLGDLGLTGIPTPENLGGAGLGYIDYAIALEEIAAYGVSYAISVAVSGLPQIIIGTFGNDEQKNKYVPKLASGEHIGAFSLTESHAGSDAAALKTTAKKDGDHYILNGTKLYTTQGNYADTMVVFARTGGEGAGGISTFIVEKNTPGMKCGKVEHKMGANISQTCEMIFDGAKIPAKNLVGAEGGFKVAMKALDSGRITIAATAVGLARAALDYCVKYASERQQFGQPIREFQGIQFMLADMYTQLEASRLLVYQAACLKDAGKPYSKEASAAKLFATDTAMKITTDAVQILGGNGYIKEYPVERYMREAKVLQIVEGANQIQRMIIGRSL